MPEKFRPEPAAGEFKAKLADVKSAEEIIGEAHDAAVVEDFIHAQRKRDAAGAESRNRALETLRSLEALEAAEATKKAIEKKSE